MPDPTNQTNPQPTDGLVVDPTASERDQILGRSSESTNDAAGIPQKWRGYYEQLVQQRDALIDATHDLQSKAREVSPDPLQDEPAEIATETFHRDQLLGASTYDQELLTEIEEAISRMRNGTYGVCQATGEQIPPERLQAVPWTKFTAQAQQEMEDRGEAAKPSLGPRGGMTERGTTPAGPWRDEEGSE